MIVSEDQQVTKEVVKVTEPSWWTAILKHRGVLSTVFAVLGVVGGILGKESVGVPVFKVEITNWPETVSSGNTNANDEKHDEQVTSLRKQIADLFKLLQESRKAQEQSTQVPVPDAPKPAFNPDDYLDETANPNRGGLRRTDN